MKKFAFLITFGVFTILHSGLHIFQFIQSALLAYYSLNHSEENEWIHKVMENPIMAFVWGALGIITLYIGYKDYKHHKNKDCIENHDHDYCIQWDDIKKIPAKILQITDTVVTCECAIGSQKFEYREFPRLLFEHISNLKTEIFIEIVISSKAGMFCTEVVENDDIDLTEFEKAEEEIEKGWEELKDFKNEQIKL